MTLLERRLRLGTGLFLAVYITQHLLNHSLGLISYELMDGTRGLLANIWRNPLINALIYLCLIAHFVLALIAIYRRSTLRLRRWELAQTILGLLIIPLLATHASANWGARVLQEVEVDYYFTISGIFSNSWYIVRQLLLVFVAWIHVCIGLHFWLRLKPWYRTWVPVLYAIALLIPVLAIVAAMRVSMDISSDLFLEEYGIMAPEPGIAEPVVTPADLRDVILIVFYTMVLAALLARWLRLYLKRKQGTFKLVHANGKSLVGIHGQTLLETLRQHGIPHASVCGGRGRCTTCRVRVGRGLEQCPRPGPLEEKALSRIDASPDIRLACQTRPVRDVHITPMVAAAEGLASLRRPGSVQGTEREVVAMFVDLRGSTRLGETRLPYDVLFILNRFFSEMTDVLKSTGGHYAQFAGDGLMALYGLNDNLESGCRSALRGAVYMQERIDAMNDNLREELDEPLRIGIGIHCGEAIVGTMGPPSAPNYSAIGDTINAAARLEALTKEFGVTLIVSSGVVQHAGCHLEGMDVQQVNVRGKDNALDVYAVATDEVRPHVMA
jgi:adenylate cyclase